MFRRQQFDRVNPRNVAPSRHTLFIRGLPGTTDVTKVKYVSLYRVNPFRDFFSEETNSKCSVDFFSTSEDKKRLSVAIRFKSHDLAKEILAKYNNKHLMGFPVELSWFKDLKKARAKSMSCYLSCSKNNAKVEDVLFNARASVEIFVAMIVEEWEILPMAFLRVSVACEQDLLRLTARGVEMLDDTDTATHEVDLSLDRHQGLVVYLVVRFLALPNLEEAGSENRRGKLRKNYQQNAAGSLRADARGFSDGQPGSFVDRNPPRNQSYRSMSRSSSSSRSSQGIQARNNSVVRGSSTQKAQPARYQDVHRTASPLNFSHASRRGQRISGSPVEDAPDYSFSNAPAPAGDGGSSLVSGLIQLKRRNQPDVNESRLPRRKRRNSVDSSSSELSAPLDTAGAGRLRTMDNRLSSLSPLANTKHLRKGTVTPDQAKEEIQSDLPKRKRQKQLPDSPDSLSPPTIRGSYVGSSKQPPSLDQQPGTRSSRQATSKMHRGAEFDRHQQSTDDSRIHASEDDRFDEAAGWPQSARRAPEKTRRSAKPVEESVADDSSFSETEFPSKRRRGTRNISKGEDAENESKTETAVSVPDDPIELIRQRKETLAQVCLLFIVYVTGAGLQAKDTELESRLMPMLKEILHERGQRCIEELRTFIADHQSELEKTEGTEIPVS
ncbi:hypothetical protein X801_10770 [Opisthorchis viverrini]|uniref:Periphilin-1 C-terminal domain-containing protein n=1 Tax=Opisthorchis viverrini TaxID=6198 RepID=A0A1S8WG67_OPIVI|nr:hypothetical protein X801_10770 [Opisthorchis viverrini]